MKELVMIKESLSVDMPNANNARRCQVLEIAEHERLIKDSSPS